MFSEKLKQVEHHGCGSRSGRGSLRWLYELDIVRRVNFTEACGGGKSEMREERAIGLRIS